MTPTASKGSDVMARNRNKNEMRPAYQPSETNACNLGCFTGCCIDPPSESEEYTQIRCESGLAAPHSRSFSRLPHASLTIFRSLDHLPDAPFRPVGITRILVSGSNRFDADAV